MTAVRQRALAKALNSRFNTDGNIEVPDPIDGVIKIINHDTKKTQTILDEEQLDQFCETWDGPGWVIMRVDSLSRAA